jgi:hypothetical protein
MSHPRIYADYHMLNFDELRNEYLPLVCYGTLKDLCQQGIILEHGLVLTFYMDSDANEDIEYDGKVEYDFFHHQWIAKMFSHDVRNVAVDHADQTMDHPCIKCRYELHPFIKDKGLSDDSVCPKCGTLVNLPPLPPSASKT